ncbi:MAG TPA: VOC family protein, partial [Burkholderiaceae bacterium]
AHCGAIETQVRGARDWLITIPADGRPPLSGALPMLIEWQSPRTPAGAGLPEAGCALAALGLRHPEPARVQALLARMGFEGRVAVQAGEPGLWADIDTPAGVRRLG